MTVFRDAGAVVNGEKEGWRDKDRLQSQRFSRQMIRALARCGFTYQIVEFGKEVTVWTDSFIHWSVTQLFTMAAVILHAS